MHQEKRPHRYETASGCTVAANSAGTQNVGRRLETGERDSLDVVLLKLAIANGATFDEILADPQLRKAMETALGVSIQSPPDRTAERDRRFIQASRPLVDASEIALLGFGNGVLQQGTRAAAEGATTVNIRTPSKTEQFAFLKGLEFLISIFIEEIPPTPPEVPPEIIRTWDQEDQAGESRNDP